MVTVNPLNAYREAMNVNTSGEGTKTSGFSDLLKQAIGGTVEAQRAAETASLKAASGEDIPMQEVIQAVSKAEMTLQTLLTVRDKAVEAYQEIMRMPI